MSLMNFVDILIAFIVVGAVALVAGVLLALISRFFGVPEDVFVGTCFVSQVADIKPSVNGIGKTSGAVENLLTSADENINIKRALDIIDEVWFNPAVDLL